MRFYGVTDTGKVRKSNQDCFIIEYLNSNTGLVCLCDGMGGANGGETASREAAAAFTDYVFSSIKGRKSPLFDLDNILCSAVLSSNNYVFKHASTDETLAGMGTTLVGGIFHRSGRSYIVNVGDSRAYLFNKKKKTLHQVTIDHSYVEDLVQSGLISREQAANHPYSNYITRAVGAENSVKPDCFSSVMHSGDIVLFCSDGLTKHVSDEEIKEYCSICSDPKDLCDSLLNLVLDRGAKDNVTLAAVVK